jgi:uncharacterized protein (TIGR02594 family)
VNCFERAERFVGEVSEIRGEGDHPLIQWWHMLCSLGHDQPDETPWCSAFVNGIAWDLRLPRSKSARARSWLKVGVPVSLDEARPDSDVVVLKRGPAPQPGPEVIDAQGHVGFFAGLEERSGGGVARKVVLVLGGNQGNEVSIAAFDASDVLGVRRL